jgi:hypothetical protein
VLQIGIRAHGFNTEPGWATNVEFEVKIPQGFDVQSARGVLRELWVVMESSGGVAEKLSQQSWLITMRLNLSCRICVGGGRPFPTVRSGKGARQLTSKSFRLRDFGEVYIC